jgi:hypothetical protein
MGGAALAYKKLFGHSMDNDLRETMEEMHVPDKAVDLLLHGSYSITGVDASSMVGLADFGGYDGGIFERIAGAPYSQAKKYYRAMELLKGGEWRQAVESASPAVLRNLLKAERIGREGLRSASGELLLNPSKQDVILQGLGFTPLSFSKKYAERDAKFTLQETQHNQSVEYNQKISRALAAKNQGEVSRLIIEANRKGIRINRTSIMENLKKARGIESRPSRRNIREFRAIKERYGSDRGESRSAK